MGSFSIKKRENTEQQKDTGAFSIRKRSDTQSVERADELDKMNTPSASRLHRAALEMERADELDKSNTSSFSRQIRAISDTLPQQTGSRDEQRGDLSAILRAGAMALTAADTVLRKADDALTDPRLKNAQANLATYTARRDAATTAEERARWQKLADSAQAQIDAYGGDSQGSRNLNDVRNRLYQAASEASYETRARRAVEQAEKRGNASYDDTFGGLLGSNYDVGRLSQDSNYAWNEYINDPSPKNRQLAELYDAAIARTSERNAAALAPDGAVETWARSAANYAPQFIDQSKARIEGGIAGSLIGLTGAGQAAGSAVDMYAITRGAAFKGLLEAGVPEEQALAMAKDEALISSIIEYADALGEYAFLGGKQIVKLLMGGGAELAKTTAGKAAGKAAAKMLAAYGLNVLQEGEEERSQEAVSIANERRLASGTTDSGRLGLARDALGVYVNEGLLGEDSADKQRMSEAAGEGRRIAAMFGALQAGSGLAANLLNNRQSVGTQARQETQSVAPTTPSQVAQDATEQARRDNLTPAETEAEEAQKTGVKTPAQTIAEYGKKLGKAGETTLNQMYTDEDTDAYIRGMTAAYNEGYADVTGEEILVGDEGRNSMAALTEPQARAAYLAGAADAQNALAQKEESGYTESITNTEDESYVGEGRYDRNGAGSVRDQQVYAGERTGGMDEAAGRAGSVDDQRGMGEASGRTNESSPFSPREGKDADAGKLVYGKEVSAKDFGIAGADTNKKVRIVESGSTKHTANAQKIAGDSKITFYGGDYLSAQGNDRIESWSQPSKNRMGIAADDPNFEADRFAGHEKCEILIGRGKVDAESAALKASESLPDGALDEALDIYQDLYPGESRESLLKEMVCDAAGNMNRASLFVDIDEEWAEAARTLDTVLTAIHNTLNEETDGAFALVPSLDGTMAEEQTALEFVGVNYDEETESANATEFSLASWRASEYVKEKKKAAKELADALGISTKQANKFINEINSIAKIIADDRVRLDYDAAPDTSSFVSNVEYGGSIDFSTICKKRRVLTGTLEAIQKAMPNGVLTADEVLKIRDMMKSRGYEVSCGLCYVEGSRAQMGKFANEFIKLFKKYHPDAEWTPNMYDVNTPTGVEKMRVDHPDVYQEYNYFWNHYGTLRKGDPNLFASQQKPKLYQAATEYNGEILQKFKNDGTVAEKNKNGGLRLQSFSDFEIIHLIDTMQVIMDMARVKLAGQAYTKVPEFAWAVGDTGLKVNLSLIAKGVDENGHIILDEVEGMPRADAEALRNAYSKNVGTILVTFNREQLLAALNDSFIDFVIPFHRSQWKKNYYDILGLPSKTKDFTAFQNEKLIRATYHEYQGRMVKDKATNFMPNEYWDFSKSGKENAETYLRMCAESNKRPKFYNLLVNNGDGSYSLQPDGSTDGYWKLLIDFKMYDNKGKGSPQMPVQPKFNMERAKQMLNDYTGGHQSFPVAQDVVDEFLAEYDGAEFSTAPNIAELQEENRELREKVKALNAAERRAAYWQGQTKRTEAPTLREGDVTRLARDVIGNYQSTLKTKDISERMKALGEFIMRGGDESGELSYEEAKDRAVDIARDVVQNAKALREGADAELLDEVKSRAKSIKITPSVAEDIPDFNEWRKANFGRMKVGYNDGVPVDVLYQELNDIAPWLFPDDITAGSDRLQRIAEALDELRIVYENPHSANMATAIEYCANDIIDGLIDESVRQTPPTFADRQAAKLEAEKQRGREKLKRLREEKNARIAEIRERGKRRVAEAVERERQKRDESIQRLKDHYRAVNDAKRERKADSDARSKLLRIVKRLQNKKLPAVSRALMNQYIGDIDAVSKSLTGKTVEKLSELEDWYLDQKKNNPDFISDPNIEAALRRLHARHIKDMTAAEVAELTETLLNIENEIRTQNKLIDSRYRHDTFVAGAQAISDIQNSEGNPGGAVDSFLTSELLSPTREMHRVTGYVDDDPLYVLTHELANGQRRMFDYQRRANSRFAKWTEDKNFVKRIAGKNADEIKIAGISKDGMTEVTITPAMRMSLYLHSKNDQNLRHIAGGGIHVPDVKLYKQGKLQEAYDRGTTIKLTPSQVRSIVNQMTMEEKAFADAASAYFNGMSRDEINATSEKLKGYSLAGVENYFPIETDMDFLKKEFDALKFDGTIEGMGFLKERVNSSAPIMLRDMNDVLKRSIDQHSRYVGLAIPVRNFGKVWGVTKSSFNEDGTRSGYESSVMQAVRQKWGSNAYDYIEKMMSDLQSPPKAQKSWGRALANVRSNYAGAVLELNASVAIKQAASYPTAASVVGWKPLFKALGNPRKVDTELIAKYTPLLWYRAQGYSNQELGDIAKKGKTLPWFLNWIQGIDLATTKELWQAAEYYVRENNKELAVGTDPYYRRVAEVYNRIIEETQPNYTTMQRPQLLRSDNELVRTLNMFKTQPFQNFNILYDAIGDLNAKKRAWQNGGSKEAYQAAKANAAKAISSQIVSAFVFALAQYGWDMFLKRDKKYKDKDGEQTLGSWLKGIGLNMVSSGFGMIPFGTELLEFGEAMFDGVLKALDKEPFFDQKWYGVDVSAVEAVNDTATDALTGLVQTVGMIQKAISSEAPTGAEWESYARTMYNSVNDVAQMAGIPLDNVRKLATGIAQNALVKAEGKYVGGYDALRITSDPSKYANDYYDLLYEAYQKDMAAYRDVYQKMINSGRFTADKIKGAMEKRMKADAGVESVDDLQERYLTPEQQAHYDKTLGEIAGTQIWHLAGNRKGLQDKTMDRLYELAVGSTTGKKMQEIIDGGKSVGLTETEYLLALAARDTVDQPNKNGNYGTYTNEERKAAIRAVQGLSQKELKYLWTALGGSDKNNPF